MRILAIVNPAAGGGRAGTRARLALANLPHVDVAHTDGPGHATRLAHDARDRGMDMVVAAGGDGTVFEVVNGLLAPSERPAPALAVLPVGTGNSFVRDFGIDGPDASVAAISANRRRNVDALHLRTDEGDLYSVNLVSFGFSATAGDLTNRQFKGFGTFGYVSAVLLALANLRAVPIAFASDGGPAAALPVTLLSFCNSQFTGGTMCMAPGADPADGELDIVRIGPMGRRRFLSSFPRIFRGTHPAMPEVSVSRARRVRFEGLGRQPVLIDGEVRTVAVSEIVVVPGALEVVA